MHVEIPEEVRENAIPQDIVGDSIWEQFPTVDTLRQASETTEDMIVAMNWEPTRPSSERMDSFGAGRGKRPPNEHRPETELQDTPGVDSEYVTARAKEILEKDPHMGQRSHSLPTHVPMVSMHRH